eukprot:Clim_evm36s33 gene=Clim_evmTU36s33
MPTYKYNVAMTCGGCSGAVERILKRLDGVDSYDIDLEGKTVKVTSSTLNKDEIMEKIAKTGKETSFAGEE